MDTVVDLDDLRVASPCKASWDDMVGEGSVRLCTLCRHDVYDISGMTRADAEQLFRERTGRTCIRLFRRADGTVMTSDCPRGLAAVRRRVAAVAAAVLGVLALGAGGAVVQAGRGNTTAAIWNVQPFRLLRDWLAPPPPPIMGIACPPTADPPTAEPLTAEPPAPDDV